MCNFYREIEYKLDDEIEEARDKMDKEQIELDKVYKDCSIVLKKFDANNHQFARDVDVLLNIYADAAKNVIISRLIYIVDLSNNNSKRVHTFLLYYL